jgi:DNA replication protein DnaC
MLNNPTVDKLRDMRLKTMADSFANPEPGSDSLTFEERFSIIVEKEWYAKKNSNIARLLSRAGFGMSACIEDIEYGKGRSISKKDVALVASCLFIEQKLNVIISGRTGTGKSYLACAIGDAACRHNYSCRYYRVPVLLAEIALARMENKYLRFMEALRKTHLLVVDDIGLKQYSQEESRDLLEIAELRYNRSSTVLASQVPHDKWYGLIPDPTIADAFMDRLVHNAYIFQLDSQASMREVMAKKQMAGD